MTIPKETVDVAFEAAKAAIRKGGAFSWVRESALSERAFMAGLYSGLRAVACEEDLQDLLKHLVLETIIARPKDDPFKSTKMSAALQNLGAGLLSTSEGIDASDAVDKFDGAIRRLERDRELRVREVKRLASQLRLLCTVESDEGLERQKRASEVSDILWKIEKELRCLVAADRSERNAE